VPAVPSGWKVTYASTVREQGTTHSSGPRILKFLPGGDFEYGMYLRDESSVSRFTFGSYEQKRLNLKPGIHTLSFYYSWWTAGTAQRNQKIHFTLTDLVGNVVSSQRNISTTHGLNENRNVVVKGSRKCELSFTIEKEQAYILQWSTEQFGFDGAIVGGVRLVYFPSVAALASKYIKELNGAKNTANQLIISVSSPVYDGEAKIALINLLAALNARTLTSPSEYLSVLSELERATKVLLDYKTSMDKKLGVKEEKIRSDVGIKEVQYYTLQGYRISNPVEGFYIVRTVYEDGRYSVRKAIQDNR